MTYRDESEQLRAKLTDTEERLKDAEAEANLLRKNMGEAAVRARNTERQLTEERQSNRTRAFRENVKWLLNRILFGVAMVTLLAGLLLALNECTAGARRAAAARASRHAQHLEAMRVSVPADVDPRIWSWCIDHCARYTLDREAAQAIVTNVFVDYGNGSAAPTDVVTVQGPWLSNEGFSVLSLRLPPENSGTVRVGSLISISHVGSHDEHVDVMPFPSALRSADAAPPQP